MHLSSDEKWEQTITLWLSDRHLYSLNEVKFLKITFHFKHFYNMLSIFSWSLKLNILLWRKIEEGT